MWVIRVVIEWALGRKSAEAPLPRPSCPPFEMTDQMHQAMTGYYDDR